MLQDNFFSQTGNQTRVPGFYGTSTLFTELLPYPKWHVTRVCNRPAQWNIPFVFQIKPWTKNYSFLCYSRESWKRLWLFLLLMVKLSFWNSKLSKSACQCFRIVTLLVSASVDHCHIPNSVVLTHGNFFINRLLVEPLVVKPLAGSPENPCLSGCCLLNSFKKPQVSLSITLKSRKGSMPVSRLLDRKVYMASAYL